MLLLDLSTASAGVAAIAVIRNKEGETWLVGAPELAVLPQPELIQLMVDGASALVNAAEGLRSRLRA